MTASISLISKKKKVCKDQELKQSEPKSREITKITHSQNTTRTYGQSLQSQWTRKSERKYNYSTHMPPKIPCYYPKMPEFSKDLNGILNFLSNLKPDKARGPDGIKPTILKELGGDCTFYSTAILKVNFYG